ncbi:MULTISPECIES: Bug family tripartite tricarboxylate transporter substrate binding protein [unclassified Variovorax]|uniref:Bug family tripartite tricarboxylate transporter substrate binding protein n=1 Tax=unclassified Variovorax TaxID=663243 RepID=UPI003F45BB8E
MNGIFLRKAGTRCLATLALVATCSAAQAAWPERPIKLIVGFTAGGGADGVARVLADSMGKTLGQAVIVENRPGAGTTLAASVVAKSPPDGYTLMLVTSTNTISPAMYKSISYKPASDFVMIGMVGRGPTLIAVPKSSGITTLAELIDRARRNPGKINYGAGGIGTTQHLGALVLQRDAGISMMHIPYKGGSETAAALLGGQLDVQFGTPPSIAPVMPKVNILASTMGKRTALAPGVPAVSETVKGFDVASWYALGGPAGMPADAVTKLAASLRTALADAKLLKQLNTLGLAPDAMSTQDATTFYREELVRWAAIVRKEGLKADD